MTVAEITAEQTIIATEHAELARVFGNAALFAGTDKHLPVLTYLEVSGSGNTVTTAATDRYTIGVDTFTSEDPVGEWTVLLEAKALLAALKTLNRKTMVRMIVTPGIGVTLDDMETTTEVRDERSDEVIFPRWRHLIPDSANRADIDAIGVSPQLMARFGKVKAERHAPMVLGFHGQTRPITVRIGGSFHGVVMPVRLGGGY